MDSMRLGGLAKMILSSRRWMLIFEDFNQISRHRLILRQLSYSAFTLLLREKSIVTSSSLRGFSAAIHPRCRNFGGERRISNREGRILFSLYHARDIWQVFDKKAPIGGLDASVVIHHRGAGARNWQSLRAGTFGARKFAVSDGNRPFFTLAFRIIFFLSVSMLFADKKIPLK
jgi:hypothetical protein